MYKKILSVFLIAVFSFSFALPVFAEGENNNAEESIFTDEDKKKIATDLKDNMTKIPFLKNIALEVTSLLVAGVILLGIVYLAYNGAKAVFDENARRTFVKEFVQVVFLISFLILIIYIFSFGIDFIKGRSA